MAIGGPGGSVTIQITGIRANSAKYKNALDKAMSDLQFETKETIDKLSRYYETHYPAPPNTSSSFKRRRGPSGTPSIAQSWTTRKLAGTDLTYQMTSIATSRGRFYARYVIGSNQQWYHRRTGWKLFRELVDEERPRFTKRCEKIMKTAAASTR